MKLGSVLVLTVLFAESLSQQVNTTDGPITGIAKKTNSGKAYYAYYSIPYAKPPTGSRRFQPTEPIDPWTEVYNGTAEKSIICYQFYVDSEEENEDCLYMNIFTPQDPSSFNGNLPVMVNIHGGGFISGSGLESSVSGTGSMSPKYFMEENVIFVSFNYRLGIFGFLSTGDDVIPGNAGLSDQILALTWVQKNIAGFGGNPEKVTILGQSAGGASVGYMILSPAASGLFAGAILESGTPLCPWAYQRNQTEISFKAGSFIDSQFESSKNSQKLLEVLQDADAKSIDAAALAYANWDSAQPDAVQRQQLQQGFYFAPVIDAQADNPVLPELQYETLASGHINKVPTLIGICSEEGLLNLDDTLNNTLQEYDENPAYLNPQDLHIANEETWIEVGNLIKQEYSPSKIFIGNTLAAIQYYTEHDFARAAVKHAELQSNYSDVYFYQFAYSGAMGFNGRRLPGSGNVTHVEEWGYLFSGLPLDNFSKEDQLVHNRLIKIWTNFASYQNPTPAEEELLQNISWPKVELGYFNYVNIGSFSETNLTVVQNKPKIGRMSFWDDIYNTYGNRPFDTY